MGRIHCALPGGPSRGLEPPREGVKAACLPEIMQACEVLGASTPKAPPPPAPTHLAPSRLWGRGLAPPSLLAPSHWMPGFVRNQPLSLGEEWAVWVAGVPDLAARKPTGYPRGSLRPALLLSIHSSRRVDSAGWGLFRWVAGGGQWWLYIPELPWEQLRASPGPDCTL